MDRVGEFDELETSRCRGTYYRCVSATEDARAIQDLIRRWAQAVHQLEVVLADHAEDIVMFDVPPPEEGVRGLAAYSDTWPPFFEWQRTGASFEIEYFDVAPAIALGNRSQPAYGNASCLLDPIRPVTASAE
jgi:ketosteroid isomerase-like protein